VYRWVDHTAELELELDGATEAEVFRDALAAFADLVADDRGEGEPARYDLGLDGVDRADLLAQWLDELVFLADTESFVPERVIELELGDGALRAVVAGRRAAPRPVVKAVTYHDLRFEHEGGRWRAHVVLDV
jgi:SHS2 domain-containing protein